LQLLDRSPCAIVLARRDTCRARLRLLHPRSGRPFAPGQFGAAPSWGCTFREGDQQARCINGAADGWLHCARKTPTARTPPLRGLAAKNNVWQIETKPAPKVSSLHTGGTSSTHQHCCLVKYGKKEKAMWIKSSLIALGFAGAMVASTPAPAPAQGVHVGPGGVSVDVGRPRYREHYRGYHDYAYDRRHGGCRTVTIERAGSTRTIRRCD